MENRIVFIPEMPGYLVGEDGTVWSVKRKGGSDRGGGRVGPMRQMKTSPDARGYAQVSLSLDGAVKTLKVHTLVLLGFIGPKPSGHEACHFPDASPSNNRLENLRWDTHQENIRDRFRIKPNGPKKTCTRCGETKHKRRGFYKDPRSSDGFASQCMACHTQVVILTRDPAKKRAANRDYMRRLRALS